jgi:Fe-Mn family superoxide dismutase
MKYTVPELPYAYDALEPHIDAQTMQLHHDKHHQAYTDKMNAVLEQYPDIADTPIEELMQNLSNLPISDSDKTKLRNNGGGYLNHKLFWEVMGPDKQVDDALVSEIEEAFGSLDSFKETFEQNALTQFGSGWSWLVRDANGTLQAYGTANQDSPLLHGDTPIFGIDVWEHAYYLKYQNKRPDYVSAWWNVLKLLP